MKTDTKTITYTFGNGLEIKGTIEQLLKVAEIYKEKLDFSKIDLDVVPSGYYPSESKGLVLISEMNDYHLRRALLKRAKDYFAKVFVLEDSIPVFLKKFTSLTDDTTVVELYNELSKR